MKTTNNNLRALTTADLMGQQVITIPQELSLRAAAQLLCQSDIGGAPVVDADGRCIGVLSARDFVHWAAEGAYGLDEVPLAICPYQLKGRLLTGEDAVICKLAEGSCPWQEMRPTTGGRRTAVCRRPQGARDGRQQPSKDVPAVGVLRYMSTDVVTVGPQTPLSELARTMLAAHIHRVIVVDQEPKPMGVVTSTDVLATLARSATPADKEALARREPKQPRAVSSSDDIPGHDLSNLRRQLVERRAYEKWRGKGCPGGSALQDWLEAETEVSREFKLESRS
jgi:CBS domain-containing protein